MSAITSRSGKLSSKSLRKKLTDTTANALAKTIAAPTSDELTRLADASGSFAWLETDSEEIYTLNDGKKAQWPTKRTRKAA